MAQRRMFSLHVVDTDAFLEMPVSSQNLYFHLGMRADDDGFVSNPKKIMRMVSSQDDDLKILLSKRFILGFENGVVVIKHWRIHNLLRKDRYTETVYLEEKSKLKIKENGSYTEWQPNGNQMATQVSIGKDSKVKDRIEKNRKEIYISYSDNVKLTEKEYNSLIAKYGNTNTQKFIEKLENYKGATGKKYKSDYKAILSWVVDAIDKGKKVVKEIDEYDRLKDQSDKYLEEIARARKEKENEINNQHSS
jgi:hypothetical protein